MDFYLRDCFIAECYVSCGTVFLLLLFCDDDISPFVVVLEDFYAVDVAELWMIDNHMLTTDYNKIFMKVLSSYKKLCYCLVDCRRLLLFSNR